MSIVAGDTVRAKKGDELYSEEFANATAVVTETHREFGGIVAKVRFSDGRLASFYVAGLQRVREVKS